MLLIVIFYILEYCYYPRSVMAVLNLDNNACRHFIDYPFKAISSNCYVNPNLEASTPEMIQLNGYNFETHETVSEDGYKSKIFRIPPRKNDNRKKRQPVILNHGILLNSEIWTWRRNKSLAFVLADAGYDVWLVNQRDSGYTTHKVYKPSDYNFWNYSFDPIAANDVPAILNTVAKVTNKSGSIIYIGHSRGTTLLFMYASEKPKEAEKFLRGFIALAPAAYIDPVFYIKVGFPLLKVLYMLKVPVLFYPVEYVTTFFEIFCTYLPHVCKFILSLSSGTSVQFLADDLLAFFSLYPRSVTVMQLVHLVQSSRSGKFQKFDYGKKQNLLMYKQEEPPLYNLSNINLPVYMFFGKHDVLIQEKNVERVFEELGSSDKEYFSVPIGIKDDKWQFGHNDFCWSKYIEEFFYKDLLRILDKLPPQE